MSASTLINSYGKAVTFHRYLAGAHVDGEWVAGLEDFLPLASQVQILTFYGLPDAGEIVFEFNGEETASIVVPGDFDNPANFNAFIADLQDALDALSTIGVNGDDEPNCEVAGGHGPLEGVERTTLTFEFKNDLEEQPLDEITVVSNTITDAGVDVYLLRSELDPAGVEANTAHTMTASVQPLRARERELLPEGQRSKEAIKIYTTTQLYTVREQDKKKADKVDWEGRTFEVASVETYTDEKDLPHYRAAAVLAEVD